MQQRRRRGGRTAGDGLDLGGTRGEGETGEAAAAVGKGGGARGEAVGGGGAGGGGAAGKGRRWKEVEEEGRAKERREWRRW